MSGKSIYEVYGGSCPDCHIDIPEDAKPGERCQQCDHVWEAEGILEWVELSEDVQEDLKAWYNSSVLEDENRRDLARLFNEKRFWAWNCPFCEERVFYGSPQDHEHFQGTLQADYVTYPGDLSIYTERFNVQLCDNCRMKVVNTMPLKLSGRGEPPHWPDE
jgi:hypothetical protein